MNSIRDGIEGGIYGLLIGDALGVPYESHDPAEIPEPELIEYQPPSGFRRAHPRVPPGTWSDDGALALNLLASLLDCGRLDAQDFGRRLVAWYDRGELAVDRDVFDVGIQTSRAIRALQGGTPALEAGPSGERDNRNGSLMRVLPLALWHKGPDESLVLDARNQSRVTHGHLRSQACCALYCLWARRIIQGLAHDLAWNSAAGALWALAASDSPFQQETVLCMRAGQPPTGQGTGYVLDTLHSARWAVQTGAGDFERTLKAAIRLGNDTDTTACVAGGIAGLVGGRSAIPERWLSGLRGRELVDPLVARLCDAIAG